MDPWMRESVSDDKNACRKVKRILSSQTDLDSEMHYVHTQEVSSTPALDSDEITTTDDIDPTSGHYSKRNVDRRAKRVKEKVSRLQTEVRENKQRTQHAEERLAKAQLELAQANSLCLQLKAQVRSVMKHAQDAQIDRDSFELELEECIQLLISQKLELVAMNKIAIQ